MQIWKNSSISPAALVFLALLLAVLPPEWILAVGTAALCHELGHLAALWLCGEKISGISAELGGISIRTGMMSSGKRLFSILAGPAAGLLPVFLSEYLPRTSVCALIFSTYNLLPVPGLDGGNALLCMLSMIFEKTAAEKIGNAAAEITGILILVLGILAFSKGFGIYPLIFSVFLQIKIFRRKNNLQIF